MVSQMKNISLISLSLDFYHTRTLYTYIMPRTTKPSPRLRELFGHMDDREVSKKLIKKLLQYNMQYEEITKVILSHTERAFLDARLISLEEYYQELQSTKNSEIASFLENLPAFDTVCIKQSA